MNIKSIVNKNLIFKCISGSHAYGLNTPESDIDYRGVFMVPPEILLNPFKNIEQYESCKDIDFQYYAIQKFFKLLKDNNPNIIELLYMPNDVIEYKHDIYKELENSRHLFLSKKAKHTYSGYAFAQLKRIKGHNKWINNPQPKDSPRPINYIRFCWLWVDGSDEIRSCEWYKMDTGDLAGLNNSGPELIEGTNKKVFFIHRHGTGIFDKNGFMKTNYSNCYDKESEICGIMVFQKELYEEDLFQWKQYWNWKKNRNKVRTKLEEKYNYDSKHASHLARLMIQCEYILADGYIPVRLTGKDLEFVKGIKNGKMTYDELIKWADDRDKQLEELYKKSKLQHSPDVKKIEKLFFKLNEKYWNFKWDCNV